MVYISRSRDDHDMIWSSIDVKSWNYTTDVLNEPLMENLIWHDIMQLALDALPLYVVS